MSRELALEPGPVLAGEFGQDLGKEPARESDEVPSKEPGPDSTQKQGEQFPSQCRARPPQNVAMAQLAET